MQTETEKIEDYIKEKLNGEIDVIYGCSLGGSFIGILMQRNNIHMKHGILGSSDLDEENDKHKALKSADKVTAILYHFIKRGKANIILVKIMQLLLGKEYVDFLLKMMVDKNGQSISFVSKESIKNQYYSDLVTKLDDAIEVRGTKVHCFYAAKMGKIYLARYKKHFKDPDIIEHNLKHEELLACRPDEWVEEVKKCVL